MSPIEHHVTRSEISASRAHENADLLAKDVVQAIQRIRGAHSEVDAHAIRDSIESCLSKHPLRPGTKRGVAMHEAGHLIGYEFEGLVAGKAQIGGPPFGRGGWGGTAWRFETPCIEHGPWANKPDEFLREAKGMLAGPLAEEVLGDGDALSSLGELTKAKLLVKRAAELSARDPGEVWRGTLIVTAAIVERYADEIEEIADLLTRRKRVTRWEPSTRKILERVRRVPLAVAGVSSRSSRLVHLIESTVPCLDALRVS